MVELVYPNNRFKRLFGVALGTVLAKLVFMDILMTVYTIAKLEPGKLLEVLAIDGAYLVAFLAQNSCMFPF